MSYSFNHVHLKSSDPGKTADWYVEAFGFEIVNDENPRPQGDRFIRCRTKDGVAINISGARTGELMGEGDATAHWGLEHFGIEVDDIEAELKRLEGLGAEVLEGPTRTATGLSIAFIQAPDDVRIEVMQLPH
ncbi:MAG: VOC family protein [SAR202 cluster bacterium]|jgi:lactoylglutathione lyase|nr:VOC family protein [SAR202 cluster bacterium]